jgi:hypothetical protein
MEFSFFFSFFIWSRVTSLMRFRDGVDKSTANVSQILCKSRKKCDGDPGND